MRMEEGLIFPPDHLGHHQIIIGKKNHNTSKKSNHQFLRKPLLIKKSLKGASSKEVLQKKHPSTMMTGQSMLKITTPTKMQKTMARRKPTMMRADNPLPL